MELIVEKLEQLLNNRDISINILVFIIFSLMIYNLDIKYILSAFMLLFFFLHYDKIKSMGIKDTDIKESIKE